MRCPSRPHANTLGAETMMRKKTARALRMSASSIRFDDSGPVQECRTKRQVLPVDRVLALHQAAVERFRGDMCEVDIVRQRSEERNTAAEKDGDARDEQAL